MASGIDPHAVCEALATHPKVVVYERTQVTDDLPLGEARSRGDPRGRHHVIAAGSQAPQCLAGLEMIAAVVRGSAPVHT